MQVLEFANIFIFTGFVLIFNNVCVLHFLIYVDLCIFFFDLLLQKLFELFINIFANSGTFNIYKIYIPPIFY